MITFNYGPVLQVGAHGLRAPLMASLGKRLPKLLDALTSRGQGFIDLPLTMKYAREAETFARSVGGKFDFVVVLGIGGSALGTRCLVDVLGGSAPRLLVLDSIDPEMIARMESVIDYRRTLFVVVSKSGTTPETVAQYMYVRRRLMDVVGGGRGRAARTGGVVAMARASRAMARHFVFITDPHRGLLRDVAARDGIRIFDVPENVGGRFSVLSPVGLVPAALAGVPITEVVAGARAQRGRVLSSDFTTNIAFQFAAVQYLLAQRRGVSKNVIMPYHGALASLADWYRQLLAESIGKRVDRRGQVVHRGITPIAGIGPADQHSQLQLYNEGPFDTLILFVAAQRDRVRTLRIPPEHPEFRDLSYLHGHSFGELLRAELAATELALTKYGRPTARLVIDRIDARSLGEMLMFFMGSVGFLGELFEVNAYDQPGVELGKQLTKKLLRAL